MFHNQMILGNTPYLISTLDINIIHLKPEKLCSLTSINSVSPNLFPTESFFYVNIFFFNILIIRGKCQPKVVLQTSQTRQQNRGRSEGPGNESEHAGR